MAGLAELYGDPTTKLNITDEGVPIWVGDAGSIVANGFTTYQAGDEYNTNDAKIKQAGSQVFAFEFRNINSDVGQVRVFQNLSNNVSGFQLILDDPTLIFYAAGGGVTASSSIAYTADGDWHSCVCVYDATAETVQVFLDGVGGTVVAAASVVTATLIMQLGSTTGAVDLDLRNFEYYTGEPTNATAWVPRNLSSMGGLTSIAQFSSGGGLVDDNDVLLNWTAINTPIITDDVIAFGSTRSFADGDLTKHLELIYQNRTGAPIGIGSPAPNQDGSGWSASSPHGVEKISVGGGVVTDPGQTEFDGTDGEIASSDNLLNFAGAQVLACEVYVDTLTGNDGIVGTQDASGQTGIALTRAGSSLRMFKGTSGPALLEQAISLPVSISTWYKLLGVVKADNTIELYIDYGSGYVIHDSSAGITTTAVSIDLTDDFKIGNIPRAGYDFLDGRVRNLEVFSGEPTTPTDHVPGNGSLVGCVNVLQSRSGNGTDDEGPNDLGGTFISAGTGTVNTPTTISTATTRDYPALAVVEDEGLIYDNLTGAPILAGTGQPKNNPDWTLKTDKQTSEIGITASVTQTQGQQPTTADVVEVSVCANASDTVTARVLVSGKSQTFINNGLQSLQVFPFSGDNIGAGFNTSRSVNAGTKLTISAYADNLGL